MQYSSILSVLIAFAAAGQALAGPTPSKAGSNKLLARQDLSEFINGSGNELFGNAGQACTVGNDVGECDQFGRCAQTSLTNEINVLEADNAECQAGGATGVQE